MLIGGIMNVILFVVLFITSCILVAGSSHFCSHIEETLKGRYNHIIPFWYAFQNTRKIVKPLRSRF